MHQRGQRLRATLALMGTIIGAGVFGVPAMIGAWGVIPATVAFAAIVVLVLAVHLFIADAVSIHRPAARLSGLAWHWLGPTGGTVSGVAQALQVFGANLAYLILGGEFLAVFFSQLGFRIPVLTWQVLFWVGGVVTVLVGLRILARVEAFLTWLLVAAMLLMIGAMVGKLDLAVAVQFPSMATFEPYGVFLFSLLGMTVIPELEEIVNGRKRDLRTAVIRGTLAAAGLTFAFGLSAWLASSGTLGRDPADLVRLLPPVLAIIVPLFGFLAVATSYVTTAYDLGSMFRLDFHFASSLAWATALGLPLALLFLTERDFLRTIGLVGAVFSAIVAIVAVLAARAALRADAGGQPVAPLAWWWREGASVLVIALLAAGGIAWLLL